MMLCKITKTGGGYEQSRVVSLPKSEVELNALLCDMNINRSNGYAYEVSFIKTGNGVLDKALDETSPNVDELNHIAGEIDKYGEKWRDALGEIMVTEQPENAVDFINIMHNADGYVFHDNISDMSDLGKEVAFRVDGIDEDSPLGMCVDFKSYGDSFNDVICMLFTVSVFADDSINIQVCWYNGNPFGLKDIEFPDAQPFVDENDRTLVPIRFIAENMNMDVEWDEATDAVTIYGYNGIGDVPTTDNWKPNLNSTIILKIGESTALVDGQEVTFDTKAVLKDDRTYVP